MYIFSSFCLSSKIDKAQNLCICEEYKIAEYPRFIFIH